MCLVYLSPVPWASFSQRPHKFVDWFHAKQGGDALWVDPYPTRLPELADFRRIKVKGGAVTKSSTKVDMPAWLTVLYPRALPIEPLPVASKLNRLFWSDVLRAIDDFVRKERCLICIGKPSALALEVLARHPKIPSHYDAMDDFPAFYRRVSRVAMEKRAREVAARVSRISVSSTALANRFDAYRSKLSLVLNACAADSLPPAEANSNRSGKPVLGYVGTIGHWFDWPLVFDLAEANPSMCIRLIGPAYVVPSVPLPRSIELLPACDHATAIMAMQQFSVGLIPFKRTELSASVDPIKYYEYRALGLPVLSTRFGEMALRDGQSGVFLADRHSDLVNLVRAAIAYECDINEIQAFRTANSWETRFDASGILP